VGAGEELRCRGKAVYVKNQKGGTTMMKFRFYKRNSPYASRQKIAFQDDYYKEQELSLAEYGSLLGILTSLRECGELEVDISSLPDPPFSPELTLTLKNSKYYLEVAAQAPLFEEMWKVVVLRERELTHLFIVKLLHFTRRLKWGRVEEEEEKSTEVSEVSSEVVA
jgi:hypothetical protein